MENQILIGFVFACAEDRDQARTAISWLGGWGIHPETAVISARLLPARAARWAGEAEQRGLHAIVVIAGREPALPEIIASHTLLPVIGVGSWAACTGTPQLPPAIRAGSAMEAALLALQIAARASEHAYEALGIHRERLESEWERQFPEPVRRTATPVAPPTRVEFPEEPRPQPALIQSIFGTPTEVPRPVPPPTPPVAPPPAPIRRVAPSTRVKIDSDILPIELLQRAVEVLQAGGIIALPTDTVYGLAVDAMNPDAAERLNLLKDRPAEKSLAVFIDSTRLLSAVATGITPDVRGLLEAFWPGPLTVVFERRAVGLDHLASGRTIGVRIPDHTIPLMLTQELRRPIACTSANPSGMPEARSADDVEEFLGRDVDLILDAGKLPPGPPSTVIDVTRTPFRILREGAISRQQLAAVAGDLIRTEG